MPLGMQYALFLGVGLIAAWQLRGTTELRHAARHPLLLWPLAFLAWMALSAAWSSATPGEILSHLWHYSLPLCMALLAATMRPADARKGLRHFVLISAAAALASFWWDPERLGGNQRIAFSILLALAAAMGVVEGLRMPQDWRRRVAWLLAACLCTMGLVLQDRRTGMLLLPLLLFALVWVRLSGLKRAAMLLLVLASTLAVWHNSDTVRARFDQGLHELRHYRSEGEINTSIGMRVRMLEVSVQMLREHPWFGHGVGSWQGLWRQRVQERGLLASHSTPHNEYLLVAAQGGAIGLMFFIAALLALGQLIWRRGRLAEAALLVWLAFVFTGLLNAVLRDAKFALPLLMLGALAWAASREPERH